MTTSIVETEKEETSSELELPLEPLLEPKLPLEPELEELELEEPEQPKEGEDEVS